MAFLKLPDLDSTSALDIVEENFKRVGLKAYAIRMIYAGEHTLTKEDVIECFRKSVNGVNAGYCEINVHGLLLVYDSYFLHIIEGSEDTIHRQLKFLFKIEEDWIQEKDKLDEENAAEGLSVIMSEEQEKPVRKMFNRLKALMVYHSISTLYFENWRAVTARPPSLVGKLDIYGPLVSHMEQLRICLDKIKKLCDLAMAEETLSFEGLSAVDPKTDALPEVALLDFLLQSPYLLDLRHVSYLHRRVDDYIFYFESVWPLPTQYTPKHLYKLKIDDSFVEPLPVMPWEGKKEEDEEKEEREQSASSSSD